ncbi:carbamoyltransferase HypF [Motiliproteus sp.]|uniref:carbamoyltransferase HypF n=1 Tax=Motiliproteus sp. TaxID=1898955 RepID=UPI003BAD00A6
MIGLHRLRIGGEVQGVGFRPHVYQLATRLKLPGRVLNDGAGVLVDLLCTAEQLAQFSEQLKRDLPPLASIDQFERQPLADLDNQIEQSLRQRPFYIDHSGAGPVQTQVAPDAATCPDCLSELFDPNDRRYRYPFINCTHCGPRYSIIRQLPYDRPATSMAKFELCSCCADEYADPQHRRFHAQPNACPDCGPQLWLADSEGQRSSVSDPIEAAVERLQQGQILAIKGIGGFHLACDADNPAAVERLRQRKHRPSKPLAVMVASPASLESLVSFEPEQLAALRSAQAPILLLAQKPDNGLPDAIAPGLNQLGVMLPYTPIQHLLFHQAAGRPAGTDWLKQPQSLRLVMTSANASGRPLVYRNDEALTQLRGIADCLLLHDRDIQMRCDDAVVNGLPGLDSVTGGRSTVVRRGRGMAPKVVRLPCSGPSTLALGGFFKNSICVAQGDKAYLSQYIGDLDNPDNCRYLEQTLDHLCALFQIKPEQVACDRHPDFYSSQFAQRLANERRLPLIEVQHHHAHAAAVAAEHHLNQPYLALTLDGLGLGDDGTLWGGELLRIERGKMTRLGAFKPLSLPGGDRAAREPWRIGLGFLIEQGQDQLARQRYGDRPGYEVLTQMVRNRSHCPQTSSAGRLFDAAASLSGLCDLNSYEAEAAMRLESTAREAQSVPVDGSTRQHYFQIDADNRLDFSPLLLALPQRDPAEAADLFHRVLIQALSQWVVQAQAQTGIDTVVLSGGCLLNRILSSGLQQALASVEGLRCYGAEQLPPNDSGLALGQAWVAIERARLRAGADQQTEQPCAGGALTR